MYNHVPSLLIKDATVLSLDPAVGDLDRGDVLVRGDRIAAVGTDLPHEQGTEILDGRGMIALPGFVDSHVHAWEGQLRGIAPVANFATYLGLTAFGYGPRYTPDDGYLGTLATALVALDAGITTLVDNSHNARSLDHAVAAAQALTDSGIRGVHAVGAPFGADDAQIPDFALDLRKRFTSPLVSVRLFDVNPSVELWQFAKDEGFWVSSETGPHTPDLEELFEELHTRGLLTAEHALNHCYDLPDRVWDLIADSGATVNLCPRSDAAFGLGSTVPPVDQALRRSIPVGLSGDNEISYGLSMFADMAALQQRHRGEVFRRAAAGDPDPGTHLEPGDVLRFATLGGAANAGLLDTVGSLTPGKQADIVLVRTTDMATFPATNPTGTITSAATAGNVDTVLVAGVVRKRRGELVGVDLSGVREAVVHSRDRLLAG
jgi:5-methylthioadenosine/S-adenosylhomocysteine deaminase